MTEIRNNFLKSRMNKDLDARLLPSGEYRDAQNIMISKSEGEDVGALENVLGNISITDFGLSATCNIDIIGIYMDVVNNNIFVFMTNFVDTSSDKLSNFAPTAADCHIGVYNVNTSVATLLVSGRFLNFSKTHPIYGVNLIEDLLFWTDNRNQPRKININSAQRPNYYTNEDQISVATYYPYQPIDLFKEEVISFSAYTGGTSGYSTGFNISTTGGSGSGLTVDISSVTGGGVINVLPTINTAGIGYKDGDVVNISGGVGPATLTLTTSVISTMQDVVSATLPDGTTANPLLNSNWPGDTEFLKDKFARFSYRFKFDDGEYSLIAPFTQECFVPQQDGYFIGDDEDKSYKSTEINFMQNKINNIILILNCPVPSGWNTVTSKLNISEIDIIYKQSNETALRVIDTITSDIFNAETTTYLAYNYQSTKPWKTLPSKDLLRVYDKTPVRALAQESAGNRVIYGNYIDKHTSPENLAYTTKIDFKLPETPAAPPPVYPKSYVRKEYQNHTLKQNRTYQVGVVLCDRYGRQSTVLLSSIKSNQIGDNKGDTNFNPFTTGTNHPVSGVPPSSDSFSYYPGGADDLLSATDTWPGDALQINFLETISSAKSSLSGQPGLYTAEGSVATTSTIVGGSGYTTSTNVATTGGTGFGLTVDITAAAGAVTAVVVKNPGRDYTVGDVITIVRTGTPNATFVVASLNTPNPLGWYTYKIVVKQTEQEYYNVYFPGVLNGYIDGESKGPLAASADEPICHITLQADNINKVPRDLSLLGPTQTTFRTGRPSVKEDPSYYEFVDSSGLPFTADPYSEEGERLLKTRDRERDLDSGSQIDNASIKLSPRVMNYTSITSAAITTPGTGYSDAENVATTGGSGTGLTVDITASGGVTGVIINNPGSGYKTGDSLIITGGSGTADFTLTVTTGQSKQWYPGRAQDTVTTIGTGTELGLWSPSANSPYDTAPVFYGYKNNPLIGKIKVDDYYIGETGPSPTANQLVYEITGVTGGSSGAEYVVGSKNLSTKPTTGGGTGVLVNIDGVDNGAGAITTAANANGPLIINGIHIANNDGDGIKGFSVGTYLLDVVGGGDSAGQVTMTVTERTWPGYMSPIFSVYETEPIESKLDIFWESSTAGLISTLNVDIVSNEDANTPALFRTVAGPLGEMLTGNFTEKWPPGRTLYGEFYVCNALVVQQTSPLNSIVLTSVIDGNGVERKSEFTASNGTTPGSFEIITNAYFYYGADSAVSDTFTFYVDVTVPSSTYGVDGTFITKSLVVSQTGTTDASAYVTLINEKPSFVTPGSTPTPISTPPTGTLLYTMDAINGSNTGGPYETNELTFTITSQVDGGASPVNLFYLQDTGTPGETALYGFITRPAAGAYVVTVQVTDGGGMTEDTVFNVTVT